MRLLNLYRLRRAIRNCFYALAKLQSIQFMGYLNPETAKHPAFYEKVLNQWRCRFLHHIQILRDLSSKYPSYKIKCLQIDKLHQVICSMHLLKLRVADQAVFDICKREMQGIEKISVLSLFALSKNKHTDPQILLDEILLFESLFSKTLQIVMNDPVVFLFFIQDLYAFQSILADLSQQ